jgi:hypothetical protein
MEVLMSQRLSRRGFVGLTPLFGALGLSSLARAQSPPVSASSLAAETFPSHDPAVVKEVVTVSHFNFARVRELVEKQPALSRASIDWGFGDWETCIDAASHVGNREIAEYLISMGARPTIFTAAMMGQLDVVKAAVAARPGIQSTYGPHGITMLAHARFGGKNAEAVLQYLTGLGDADKPMPSIPIADADRDALVGKYVYGPGPRDYFTIDVQRDRLGIDRPGGPTRRDLGHIGDLVFFPQGVASVKIAFSREAGKVTQFTIADPQVYLTAKRA